MDQNKQARPEAQDQPVSRVSEEVAHGMTNGKTFRPIIEADRAKPLTGDFASADELLSLLRNDKKLMVPSSDERTSPGIKPKAQPEEQTIIDSWTQPKDNGSERLKNGRQPVKDFYFEAAPVTR